MTKTATILGLVLLVLTPVTVFGQTGKIAGRVIDTATGDPLPGVNVVIDGTTQGTSTGLDGDFVIIGVRPGVYAVVASFVGFSTQRRTGVQVNLDLTTTVNFQMQEEVVQGEEIVVTAEAITVRKDLTSSEARVTAEKLDRLPVTELGQVLDVQAGITTRGGGLHIRGGRSSEVVFMVDGVPITDGYDGSRAIELENDGIQELQVISGTFNAEFGNAMSGVINIVTKEGRNDRFGGSVQLYTGGYAVTGDGGKDYLRGINVDEFSQAGIQYRDVDAYSYLPFNASHFKNATVSLEGPIIRDRASLFALGRYFQNDGWLYGAQIYNPDGTAGDSSLVPMNNWEKFSWQGNLKLRLSRSLLVNVITLGSKTESRPYSLFRRWSPEGRNFAFDDGYDVKLKLTHLISNTTFYTLDFATFFREFQSYRFENPFDSGYNDFDIAPPDSVEFLPGQYQTILTGGGRYARGGTDLGQFRRSTRSYLFKGDISRQFNDNHLVKAGFQVQVDNLELTNYTLIPAVDESGARIEPFVPAIPDSSTSAFTQFQDVSPLSVSAYLQDKMEFENFIVNAGVRFDYYDPRAQVPADPTDPNIFNPLKKINRFRDTDGNGVITVDEETPGNALTRAEREAYWWKDSEVKIQVSPRLGVAYPITTEGVIHFSYGLFFQVPRQSFLFDNFGYKLPVLSGQHGPFGNPDLEAEKTTLYEIGFRQGFGDYVIDLTGYYRDVRNWVSTSPLILSALPGVTYVIYSNRDYSNTRGLTLTLSKTFRDHWGFDASYTYQVVDGSASNPQDEFFSLQANNQPTLALLPLDWDQRHKIAGAFYAGADTYGGSLRFRVESGFPYTPRFESAANVGNDVQPEFPRNFRRMASTFEVDVSLYKEFPVGNIRPRVFLEVFNLLDTRNVQTVFDDTGEPDVTIDQLRTGAFDAGFYVRPDHYREPRRIQLGVEFRF